MIESNS